MPRASTRLPENWYRAFRVGYNHVLGGVDRVTLWEQRDSLRGKLVKFKHQPSGAKEAPRFPKFIGFREATCEPFINSAER